MSSWSCRLPCQAVDRYVIWRCGRISNFLFPLNLQPTANPGGPPVKSVAVGDDMGHRAKIFAWPLTCKTYERPGQCNRHQCRRIAMAAINVDRLQFYELTTMPSSSAFFTAVAPRTISFRSSTHMPTFMVIGSTQPPGALYLIYNALCLFALSSPPPRHLSSPPGAAVVASVLVPAACQ